jgi:F0F1-type ATP synthase assembly protein I
MTYQIATMREVAASLVLLFGVVVLIAYIVWAVRDARRRGKSVLPALIAVLCFFPFGLIAWLLFRPTASPARVRGRMLRPS